MRDGVRCAAVGVVGEGGACGGEAARGEGPCCAAEAKRGDDEPSTGAVVPLAGPAPVVDAADWIDAIDGRRSACSRYDACCCARDGAPTAPGPAARCAKYPLASRVRGLAGRCGVEVDVGDRAWNPSPTVSSASPSVRTRSLAPSVCRLAPTPAPGPAAGPPPPRCLRSGLGDPAAAPVSRGLSVLLRPRLEDLAPPPSRDGYMSSPAEDSPSSGKGPVGSEKEMREGGALAGRSESDAVEVRRKSICVSRHVRERESHGPRRRRSHARGRASGRACPRGRRRLPRWPSRRIPRAGPSCSSLASSSDRRRSRGKQSCSCAMARRRRRGRRAAGGRTGP